MIAGRFGGSPFIRRFINLYFTGVLTCNLNGRSDFIDSPGLGGCFPIDNESGSYINLGHLSLLVRLTSPAFHPS